MKTEFPDSTWTEIAPPDEQDKSAPIPFPQPASSRYEIVEQIGAGGMGRVFRALDRVLDREVAIKELSNVSTAGAERFCREARIASRLQHPAIVAVYDAGRWSGHDPFYVMRLVEGQTLAERIAKSKDLDERLKLVSAVERAAEATAYAHSKQVIHRDIKPSNVVLGDYGEVFLVDWGIAKRVGEPDQTSPDTGGDHPSSLATATGAILGTPAYMSPEQAKGDQVDTTADVYSLGATLFHVIAGRPPERHSVDLAQIPTEAPNDLISILRKALSATREARYSNAREFADDLRRFSQSRLVSARRYTLAEVISRWYARNRPLTLVAASALCALAIAGYSWVDRQIQLNRASRSRLIENTINEAELLLDRDPTSSLATLKDLPRDGRRRVRANIVALDASSRGVAKHVIQGFPSWPRDVTILSHATDPLILVTSGTQDMLVRWVGNVTVAPLVADGASLRYSVALNDDTIVGITADGDVARVHARLPDTFSVLERPEIDISTKLTERSWRLLYPAFHANCDSVAIGHYDGAVTIWRRPPMRSTILRPFNEPVDSVRVACDGLAVAVQSASGEVQWARLDRGAEWHQVDRLAVLDLPAQVTSRGLWTAESDRVFRWPAAGPPEVAATKAGDQVWNLVVHEGELVALWESGMATPLRGKPHETPSAPWQWKPPGTEIGCRYRGPDTRGCVSRNLRTLALTQGALSVPYGSERVRLYGHRLPVTAIDVDDSGMYVASIDAGGELRVWDRSSPPDKHMFFAPPLPRICGTEHRFRRARDVDVWLARSLEGKLCVFRETWRPLDTEAHTDATFEVSASGNAVAMLSGRTVSLLDTSTDSKASWHVGESKLLAVSPQSSLVASSDGSSIQVWTATGELVKVIRGDAPVRALRFSATHLTAWIGDELVFQPLEDGETWRTSAPKSPIRDCHLRYSRNEQRLAAFCWRSTSLHLVDVATRNARIRIARDVLDVSFNESGRVAAVLRAGLVEVLHVDSEASMELNAYEGAQTLAWPRDGGFVSLFTNKRRRYDLRQTQTVFATSRVLAGYLDLMSTARNDDRTPSSLTIANRPQAERIRWEAPEPVTNRRITAVGKTQPSDEVKWSMVRLNQRQLRAAIRYCVLSSGQVERVRVDSSSGYPSYDEALAEAVRSWRFKPAAGAPLHCTVASFVYSQSD